LTQADAGRKAALVYSDQLASHVLSDSHPMRPIRLAHTYELVRQSGLLESPNANLIAPREATEAELTRVHSDDYLQAVKTLAVGSENGGIPYGFGPGDNPIYDGIYQAQALSAGSAMVAMELVESDDYDVAFAPAGGLHHAMPTRASGFCVFNDPAMAIQAMVDAGRRVVYIDIDCHHGDGVQHIFYDSDQVLTISLHESGQFLFPGSGFVGDIGTGMGEGFSVNVPLAPHTGDAVYATAFDAIVTPLTRAFQPDVIVTQLGMDTHVFDPITHLRLTTQGFARTVAKLSELADEAGKWIALGGGGYDLGAVARGWSMAFAVMSEQRIPDAIPESFDAIEGIVKFADVPPGDPEPVMASQIAAFADRSIEEITTALFPRFGI
jgi:acetoin utilization protein AcuC